MKLSILFATGLMALSFGFMSQAEELPEEREVIVGINEAFVPSGFDSESGGYVVVSGLFPNGCYQWKEARVNHDRQNNVHEVRSVASVSQGMCIMVLVPFTKEVRLGHLEAGEHKIRFISGDGTYLEKTVTVE